MIGKFVRALKRFWRSSITGRFVTREYAESHKDTTQEGRRK